MDRWIRSRSGAGVGVVGSAVVALIGSLTAGCIDIKGGAVEVPWAIFDANGRRINDCACAVEPSAGPGQTEERSIAFVRLDLASSATGAEPCAGLDSCRFACSRMIGATPFIIPPGQYQMSLSPLAADGTELLSIAAQATPPVSRDVVMGQPTELEAFVFIAGCASRCNGGSVTLPCTGG